MVVEVLLLTVVVLVRLLLLPVVVMVMVVDRVVPLLQLLLLLLLWHWNECDWKLRIEADRSVGMGLECKRPLYALCKISNQL